MKTTTLTLIAFVCATTLATTAVAQNAAWKGQDNEFGSIRAPYTVDMEGQRAPVQAQVILRDHYAEKDGRFFMFAFDVQNTPLDVQFDHLVRADTGEDMPCYQRQGESQSQIKCFVDLHNMPPEGTEIIMSGTVGSSRTGTFNVGAIVVPFTATWMKIPMSSGLDAELYAGTQVNVQSATSGSNTLGGMGNKVPHVGIVGLGAAALAAAGLLSLKNRRD